MKQPNDSSVDADVAAMKSTRKTPLLVVAAVVLGAAGGGAGYTLYQSAALASDLEQEGFTDVKVSIAGPFMFTFSGRKGLDACSGSATRLPVHTSSSRSCVGFQVDPEPAPAAPPPPRNVRADVEGSLAKNYKRHGFETFSCPEITTADSVSCNMTASNGVTVAVDAVVTKRGADGLWEEWTTKPSKRVLVRQTLAKNLEKTLAGMFEKKGRKATPTIDCGAGPLVVSADPLECDVKTDDRVTAGKAKVTFDQAGEDDKVTFTGV